MGSTYCNCYQSQENEENPFELNIISIKQTTDEHEENKLNNQSYEKVDKAKKTDRVFESDSPTVIIKLTFI